MLPDLLYCPGYLENRVDLVFLMRPIEDKMFWYKVLIRHLFNLPVVQVGQLYHLFLLIQVVLEVLLFPVRLLALMAPSVQ